MNLDKLAKLAVQEAVYRTPWGVHLYHRYDYAFSPGQLATLVGLLDETKSALGCVLELGCAYGITTVFMSRHLRDRGDQRRITCVDTFAGFTKEDTEFEVEHRAKTADYSKLYPEVTMKRFQRTLKNNQVINYTAIVADANLFDFDRVSPISFALLDVDLYRPMRRAIAEAYDRLSPGGIIACDDCTADRDEFDGALQAYTEFVEERGLPSSIADGIGIIRR